MLQSCSFSFYDLATFIILHVPGYVPILRKEIEGGGLNTLKRMLII